jgi:hypothetical protein
METCLPSRCPETGLVYTPNSRSLHGNGSTLHYVFSTASRPTMRPTQPHIQWVPGGKAAGDLKLNTHLHLASR